MSDYQRQTAFLRRCLLYDDTEERHRLEDRIIQTQRDELCVRRAVWLMALLAALAMAGLGYSAVFMAEYPLNVTQFTARFVVKALCVLGATSLFCLLGFLVLGVVFRRKLDQDREVGRRLALKVLELRLGQPQPGPSSPGSQEESELVIVRMEQVSETDGEQTTINRESSTMIKTSTNPGRAMNVSRVILAVSAAALIGGLTGCAGTRHKQSTGEWVDDKADSSRVRRALSADTQYKYGDVDVQTFKGVVQLSGFVNSRDQKNRAGELARNVEGVQEVENNITVKESAD